MSGDKHDLLNDSDKRIINNNNNHLINKLINKSTIIKSISFKKPEFNKLLTFMEVARRERQTFEEKTGFSTCVKKAMWEYLKKHPLPNPQPTLDRSLNLDMPVKPTNACCVPHCRTTARYILMLKNFKGVVERFPVCRKHRNWKHKDFRWLVGKKEVSK